MDLIFIYLLKINLFLPWYSWKIGELALNNNHSLTHLFLQLTLPSYDKIVTEGKEDGNKQQQLPRQQVRKLCIFEKVRVVVFNATFNNISVISWRSVLLMEETGVLGENHLSVVSHWQTLLHNVVLSTPCLSETWTHKIIGDGHWLHR